MYNAIHSVVQDSRVDLQFNASLETAFYFRTLKKSLNQFFDEKFGISLEPNQTFDGSE